MSPPTPPSPGRASPVAGHRRPGPRRRLAATAGWPPPGVPSGHMPWEHQRYESAKRPKAPPPQRPPANAPYAKARANTVQITILPLKHADPRAVAYVVAHLPKGADLWVEGVQMVADAKNDFDTLVSPPLEPGKTYRYTVRVRWPEDGGSASQTHQFAVKAGEVHCVDVVPRDAAAVDRQVATSLATLGDADRPAAERQKACAVQDGVRLGSMGPPVKVSVKGKDVYLCCPAWREAALKDPDKTLATAQRNAAGPAGKP